ncbi:MAG: thiamine-phosphate kinase [Alphaproteobacteria bacterium]
MDEFETIARVFRPLAARTPEALGLADDAAVYTPPAGRDLVVTTDLLVAGVHFRPDDAPDAIARKAVGVNVSDLSAMGATAAGFTLALALPDDLAAGWLERFAAGLAVEQSNMSIRLWGGDLSRTPGPLTLSVTAIGHVPAGRAVRRSTAAVGDEVWVSGTVGDGALGLAVLQGRLAALPRARRQDLVTRYHVPPSRVELAPFLPDMATAAIDLSDGLLADLGHVAEESAVAATVALDLVPRSVAVRAALALEPDLLDLSLTGGDDYELLFTVPAGTDVEALTPGRLCRVTRIGAITAGSGVTICDQAGRPLVFERQGWRHSWPAGTAR